MDQLYEMGSIGTGAPVQLCVFDPAEELLWCGGPSALVRSYLMPHGTPHAAFPADSRRSPTLGVFPYQYGVVALATDAVTYFSKGGLTQAEVRTPELAHACSGVLAETSSAAFLAVAIAGDAHATGDAGVERKHALSLLDLSTTQVTTRATIEQVCLVVSAYS